MGIIVGDLEDAEAGWLAGKFPVCTGGCTGAQLCDEDGLCAGCGAQIIVAASLGDADMLRDIVFCSSVKPAVEALDKIAEMCGCGMWDYPGQVIRDVAAVVAERDALKAELEKHRGC